MAAKQGRGAGKKTRKPGQSGQGIKAGGQGKGRQQNMRVKQSGRAGGKAAAKKRKSR